MPDTSRDEASQKIKYCITQYQGRIIISTYSRSEPTKKNQKEKTNSLKPKNYLPPPIRSRKSKTLFSQKHRNRSISTRQTKHVFRTFKSHLETRPMFHWTDSRIKSHLCLCYIAYTLLNNLRITLSKKQILLSENQITNLD